MSCYATSRIFILQQYERKQFAGTLKGYALFFDIADFTPIGTKLQKHGNQGAEELIKFLDFVFGEAILRVEQGGGFVSLLAGDAFCAIFPPPSTVQHIAAVLSFIRAFFCELYGILHETVIEIYAQNPS